MKKLTKEQGIILTGFTGKLCCVFSDFHKDIEKRLNRPVFSHELAYLEGLKEIYRKDFMKIFPKQFANTKDEVNKK